MDTLNHIEELPAQFVSRQDMQHGNYLSLLDYVQEVADEFSPAWGVADDEGERERKPSWSPADFTRRYLQGKVDTSFKQRFLQNEDLQHTLAAFQFDVSKFWYLLLFVYDYVECSSNDVPKCSTVSRLDDFKAFAAALASADTLTLRQDGHKTYDTHYGETLRVIRTAVDYFVRQYQIAAASGHLEEHLADLGWYAPLDKDFSFCLDKAEGYTWSLSHKKLYFIRFFQYFLRDKEALAGPDTLLKISRDKNLLISRLLYTVGYANEDYNEEYDPEGHLNRKLSNFMRKYKNAELPVHGAKDYAG